MDKPLENLTKVRKNKTQINKIRNEIRESTRKTPRKSRESLGTTLKNFIQINWKI
jgi:hypothetical protein